MSTSQLENVTKITLKSVYSKDRKLILQPAKDEKTGWYKGVPRLSDEDKKKLKFWVDPDSKLTITHNYTFDLTKEEDKMNWDWVKESNAIALSFEEAQYSAEALFYVDSEEVEARKSVESDEILHKAMSYIFSDRTDMLADRARILGHNMDGESPVTIKEMLLKMAKNKETTRKVIDAYENGSVAIHLLFLKARDKNIIKVDNGAFMYGSTVLGVTDEAAVKTLQDPLNRELAVEIDKEVNLGKQTTKTAKNETVKAGTE